MDTEGVSTVKTYTEEEQRFIRAAVSDAMRKEEPERNIAMLYRWTPYGESRLKELGHPDAIALVDLRGGWIVAVYWDDETQKVKGFERIES